MKVHTYDGKKSVCVFLISAVFLLGFLNHFVNPTALAETSVGSGLKGEYYDNMDLTNLKMTRTDAEVNLNWGEGSPDASIGLDTFSVRWTGSIKPKYTETYTFYMEADDGVRLWVNGQLLIDSWVTHASERTSQAIALTAGQQYDIRIEYFENGGGAVAKLWWSSASQSKQSVPQSQLYPPAELPGVGLRGEYYDNMDLTNLKMTRTDAEVNLNWVEGSPDASIGSDTFSVRWTGSIKPKYSETYTFYMEADDGVRLWVNGQLLIDSWVTYASERTSQAIALTAGQQYDIRIEYFENGGGAVAKLWWSSASQRKQSVPQSQLYPPAELPGVGLKGEYYDNMDLTNLKMTRTDAEVNLNWGEGSPDASIGSDTFSVRWTGSIKPKYSETYTFYMEADDGVRLWVNGQLLIDSWVTYASERTSQAIALTAGQQYDIRIEYFENGGGAIAKLWWSSASQSKQSVPQSQLYPPAELPGVGLKGEYYDNMDLTNLKLTRTDASVNYNWGTGSPDAAIGADMFSVRWTGTIKPKYSETYTFYMNSDDGVRLWIDGQLLIDKWVMQASELASLPIRLTAGQQYDIRIEYFENGGGAVAELRWSSANQTKQIVPQSQLYFPTQKSSSVEYYYDAAGRLEYIRLTNGTVIRYYYDANGNLIRKTSN